MQIEVDERELATIQGALTMYEGLLNAEIQGKSLVGADGQLRDRWLIRAVASMSTPLIGVPGIEISSAATLWEPLGPEEVHILSNRLSAVTA